MRSGAETPDPRGASGAQKQLQDNAATRLMQAMLEQTLGNYPLHFQAACSALRQVPQGDGDFACVGAAETTLTEDAMTVAFDFRCQRPEWRRIIIQVTMSFGTVTETTYQHVAAGQHCGIKELDALQQRS